VEHIIVIIQPIDLKTNAITESLRWPPKRTKDTRTYQDTTTEIQSVAAQTQHNKHIPKFGNSTTEADEWFNADRTMCNIPYYLLVV
jgi:hypothetical protein